jgi:hypothetical protein
VQLIGIAIESNLWCSNFTAFVVGEEIFFKEDSPMEILLLNAFGRGIKVKNLR